MHSDRAIYVVLSPGRILGVSEKLFAVPWNTLTRDTVNKRFILNSFI